MELLGKTVVVTGDGRGIGAAIAHLLCENGARLVAADIREDWGSEVLERLRSAGDTASFLKRSNARVDVRSRCE